MEDTRRRARDGGHKAENTRRRTLPESGRIRDRQGRGHKAEDTSQRTQGARDRMKECGRSFEENYRDLVQISEEGADIYGSELVQDILGADCRVSAAELSLVLLKMQLEQEWFLRQRAEGVFWGRDDVPGSGRALHQAVCECVGRRLERYCGEARRGALLELVDRLEGMGQALLRTQEERAVAARLPEGELVSLAAEGAERHAGRLWGEYEEDGGESGEQGRLLAGTGPSGAAAALAVAAYAAYPGLRCTPELLADVSAAAARLAHVPREEAAGTAAYMALLLAAASLVEPGEAFRPAGAEVLRERAAAFFRPYRQLFAAELRLIMGAAAPGLLAEAAAAAGSFQPGEPQGGRSLYQRLGAAARAERPLEQAVEADAEQIPEEETLDQRELT